MIRWIFLLLLLGLMKILGGLGLAEAEALGFHASMAFGFLILSGYLAGEAAQRVHLPRITGYLLAGVLCGPDLLAVLDQRIVHYLKTIDQVALFYIALTAGGELDWRSVRPQLRRILSLGGAQLVPGWLLVLGVFLLASGQLEFLAVLSWQAKLAACAILAIISVAVSPATTVAVIVETRARGPLRDLALGTTVLMDVVVIIAFTLVLSQSGAVLGAGHEAGGILHECFILGLSILLGTGVGFLLRLFLHSGEKARKRGLALLLLALGLFLVRVSADMHLDGLILAVAAGFVVRNTSSHGEHFLGQLELVSQPIFLVFFGLAGAALDLRLLLSLWPLALLFVLARLLAKFASVSSAAWLLRLPHPVRNRVWMSFLGQAGVSLGFAALVAAEIPGVGDGIREVVVAAVVVNQVLGPVLFKMALAGAGEIPTES